MKTTEKQKRVIAELQEILKEIGTGVLFTLVFIAGMLSTKFIDKQEAPKQETIILLDSTKVVQQGVIQGGFVIEIGKHYIIDRNLYFFNINDPFRKPQLEEVVVLDIKQGYVLYKYIDDNYEDSSDIEFFVRKFTPKN